MEINLLAVVVLMIKKGCKMEDGRNWVLTFGSNLVNIIYSLVKAKLYIVGNIKVVLKLEDGILFMVFSKCIFIIFLISGGGSYL